MKVASAGVIKGLVPASKLRDLPAPGTALRALYDLYYAHRGAQVPRGARDELRDRVIPPVAGSKYRSSRFQRMKIQLTDFYGCDIRNHALVGEWAGRVYIDYTAPAVERAL